MVLRSRLRRWVETWSPKWVAILLAIRSRRRSHQVLRSWGLVDLNREFIERFGNRVRSGPFKGVELPPATWREHIGPHLAGSYEQELHPWIYRLGAENIEGIVDVGASFGYYAIGLKLLFPTAHVLAIEPDPWSRKALVATARANSQPEPSVHSFVDDLELARQISGPSLVVSDCEGYEARLFTPLLVGALSSSWVLVELHEHLAPGCGVALRKRFSSSHEIERIKSEERLPEAWLVEAFGRDEASRIVTELRGEQEWVLFSPKRHSMLAPGRLE